MSGEVWVRLGRDELRGRAWGDKPVEPSDSRGRCLCCCYRVELAKVGTEVQSLQRQPTSPMACEGDTGAWALRVRRRRGTGRAGDTAQRQEVSKRLTGQPAVCVGDWRGYVSAVGIAFSGVAGDGVVVGIRNAEAEVLKEWPYYR